MFIPRNLNLKFGFQIHPVTGRDFPVTVVTGNPEPPREIFSVGNQNLASDYTSTPFDGRDKMNGRFRTVWFFFTWRSPNLVSAYNRFS
jgi:hypothetical protein